MGLRGKQPSKNPTVGKKSTKRFKRNGVGRQDPTWKWSVTDVERPVKLHGWDTWNAGTETGDRASASKRQHTNLTVHDNPNSNRIKTQTPFIYMCMDNYKWPRKVKRSDGGEKWFGRRKHNSFRNVGWPNHYYIRRDNREIINNVRRSFKH